MSAVPTREFAVRGKIRGRGVVFYFTGQGQYARAYVVPHDPRTARQQEMRALMGAVSRAWGMVLTPEQHWAWNAAARKVLSRRRPQRPLTGQELFVKLNSVLALVGRELLVWPPGRVREFGPNPVQKLTVRWEGQRNPKSEIRNPNGDGGWRVELEVAGPVVEDLLIYGEAPVSGGRRKARHPVYLGVVRKGECRMQNAECGMRNAEGGRRKAECGVGKAECGVLDITEWYVGRFGEPGVGQRVFICAQQQRDGWRDEEQVFSEVVAGGRQNEECRMKKQRPAPTAHSGRGREEGCESRSEGRGVSRGGREGHGAWVRQEASRWGAGRDGEAPRCIGWERVGRCWQGVLVPRAGGRRKCRWREVWRGG
ncbi:MAG: hypothetical protein ABSD29_21035 [Verrucomicrobiota bacterium]|jgi:hypothetical protein